jgi:hypothetical protein
MKNLLLITILMLHHSSESYASDEQCSSNSDPIKNEQITPLSEAAINALCQDFEKKNKCVTLPPPTPEDLAKNFDRKMRNKNIRIISMNSLNTLQIPKLIVLS